MDMRTLLARLNHALKTMFSDYRGVYFYGSRQRGDFRDDSDYDLVFVFETKPDWRKEDLVRELVYQQEVEQELIIDGKYYALDEIEHYRTPFCETVSKEGKFYGV